MIFVFMFVTFKWKSILVDFGFCKVGFAECDDIWFVFEKCEMINEEEVFVCVKVLNVRVVE